MSWANASYLDTVKAALEPGHRLKVGKAALDMVVEDGELPDDALLALRRYSESSAPGMEDGKVLNRALIDGNRTHDDWAEAMDGAFLWSFPRDVLLWRGGACSPADVESPCFVSTTLVERKARQFRDRGKAAPLTAIILPAGSPVAIPSLVWGEGDDARTLDVVGREMEIILPRGTALTAGETLLPFPDKAPHIAFSLVEAVVPRLEAAAGMRI